MFISIYTEAYSVNIDCILAKTIVFLLEVPPWHTAEAYETTRVVDFGEAI